MRTREAVLRAAAEVFEQHGYAAATVDQIAEAARATKGAVYFHFPSKAALAQEVVAQQHRAWADLAGNAEGWGLTALDTVERLVREVARGYATNPLMRAGVRLANEHARLDAAIDTPFVGWIGRLTAMLRAGQRDGSVDPTLNPAASARAIVASFYGVQEVSSRLTNRRDLDRRVREWWGLTRRGLDPQPSQSGRALS